MHKTFDPIYLLTARPTVYTPPFTPPHTKKALITISAFDLNNSKFIDSLTLPRVDEKPCILEKTDLILRLYLQTSIISTLYKNVNLGISLIRNSAKNMSVAKQGHQINHWLKTNQTTPLTGLCMFDEITLYDVSVSR